jgi:hypothetical protein
MCIAIFRRRKQVQEHQESDDELEYKKPATTFTIPRVNFLVYTEYVRYFKDDEHTKIYLGNYAKYCKLCDDMFKFLDTINDFYASYSIDMLDDPTLDVKCIRRYKAGVELLKRTIEFRKRRTHVDVFSDDSNDNRIVRMSEELLKNLNSIKRPRLRYD